LRRHAEALDSRYVAGAHRHTFGDPLVPDGKHRIRSHHAYEQREALLVGHLLLDLARLRVRSRLDDNGAPRIGGRITTKTGRFVVGVPVSSVCGGAVFAPSALGTLRTG